MKFSYISNMNWTLIFLNNELMLKLKGEEVLPNCISQTDSLFTGVERVHSPPSTSQTCVPLFPSVTDLSAALMLEMKTVDAVRWQRWETRGQVCRVVPAHRTVKQMVLFIAAKQSCSTPFENWRDNYRYEKYSRSTVRLQITTPVTCLIIHCMTPA